MTYKSSSPHWGTEGDCSTTVGGLRGGLEGDLVVCNRVANRNLYLCCRKQEQCSRCITKRETHHVTPPRPSPPYVTLRPRTLQLRPRTPSPPLVINTRQAGLDTVECLAACNGRCRRPYSHAADVAATAALSPCIPPDWLPYTEGSR